MKLMLQGKVKKKIFIQGWTEKNMNYKSGTN